VDSSLQIFTQTPDYCLLIASKVVVKFRYCVGLRDLEYGHAE